MLPAVWNRVRSSIPSSHRCQRCRIRVETLEDRSLPAYLTAPSFPAGMLGGADSEPIAVAVGDFNRDGRLDVATANKGTRDVSVLLGNGNGTFKASMNFPIGREPNAILAGDLNGDG
ncbi:MAG TPA: VCBS repeat-containing protein, partial [Gemmataceae bacterium]|nr:VCBS repeat-containing protein [Gemmataceae bacterium]